ncbi:DNA repair protein RadC [Patescibacteria group bacterium]|nr:DNA repair protein RadC [Patescibacteria group bacterium]
MTIHDMPVTDRPRERLYALGPGSLSLHELLQIILTQGSGSKSVVNVVHDLLSSYKTLSSMEQAGLRQLQELKGIGYAKAAQLKAALELARRFESEQARNAHSIFNTDAAYRLARTYLVNKQKEHLLLFCLDVRLRPVSEPQIVSVGTLDCSLVHPREIFDCAIRNSASKILLAHNHPSGQSSPSSADIQVTRQIFEASKIMAIELIDHIVVGSRDYTSIREQEPKLFTS